MAEFGETHVAEGFTVRNGGGLGYEDYEQMVYRPFGRTTSFEASHRPLSADVAEHASPIVLNSSVELNLSD